MRIRPIRRGSGLPLAGVGCEPPLHILLRRETPAEIADEKFQLGCFSREQTEFAEAIS
jgi:hypothetical protein